MVLTRWPTIWKPDTKSVWEMAIRKPDRPALGGVLYSKRLLTGQVQLWNGSFKFKLEFDNPMTIR
jgi:hypothetical protein